MDEADPARRRARSHVRLGDRVVAAEDHGKHARRRDIGDGLLDGLVGSDRVGRKHGRVAEIHDAQRFQRVDAGLEVRARREAGGANRARPVARTRPVGNEVVRRRPDDRDVEAGKLGRIHRVRLPAVGEEACEVGLLAVATPALEGVDHAAIFSDGANRAACRRRGLAHNRSGSSP
jgi:hypothetical protein